ncbi:MAG TPA: Gfo/Idh/MocA family oxidoreductase, partial [Microbacteriaceae bacterium]|nr:Gfo/Idh/MocA family oxidoreductase [Microbacteriaceae bacterium]
MTQISEAVAGERISAQHPLRVGIVGTGGISRIHAENIARLGGRARIVAATDIDEARVNDFVSQWDVDHGYPSIEALLDGEPLDIVHL